MSDYLGPAGIFSTDNAQSDQNQIDCEQFDPNEDQEPDSEEEMSSEEPQEKASIVSAWCEVSDWYTYETIGPSEYEAFKAMALEDHKQNCTCCGPKNFRIDEPFKK
jgi:hypothetical protein